MTETKAFLFTSELLAVVGVLAALAISTAVSDSLDASLLWPLATLLLVGYVFARGLAKANSGSTAWDPREELGGTGRASPGGRQEVRAVATTSEGETRQMSTVTREDYGTQMGGPAYGPAWGYGRGWGGGMRQMFPTETKPFFLTSEFWGSVALIVALAIAAGTVEGVDARLFWILATAITVGYVLSRGIAKSGTKSRSWDPREELTQRLRERVTSGDER